jgi:cellulose synthase/poly-beta-1,6-N-acetylglucosamine synthase-like glycosyltransferase
VSLVAHIFFAALALPAIATSLYLLAATVLSRATPHLVESSRSQRFDIVIPAHNEAATIASVILGLQHLDWPLSAFHIVVVADNCTDGTAARAHAAGVEVLERSDPTLLGKGFALDYAFHMSLERAWADAVVVIDADSQVSANFLEVLSRHLESGAQAIQARYGVLNSDVTWRTRLTAIALAAFHDVRSRARERLRLSCGLRGNGWCVTTALLRVVPYQAFSLAEDVEYGITLGVRGCRVHYADDARIAGAMPSGARGAQSQRRRWEDGRRQLLRAQFWPLLRIALLSRDLVCADLAFDLLVLPLSYLVVNLVILLTLAAFAQIWLSSALLWVWVATACGLALALHVLRGWQLSKTGAHGLLALAFVPAFIVWKVVLMWRTHDSTEWVRTSREGP